MNIETKIKRWLKLLTLKALKTTNKQIFQIKQNIASTIKHYSEISGHLLKISSIASAVIIVASFITYNYFFFTHFKKNTRIQSRYISCIWSYKYIGICFRLFT